MKQNFKTREEYLAEAYRLFTPRITAHGTLPKKVNIIVSWPHSSKTAIGECYPEVWTPDKSTYITISPALGSDMVNVLATLLHEMIHAIGIKNHGKPFKKVALALGLTGKMRSTVAGEELAKELAEMVKTLGAYPHTQLLAQKRKRAEDSPAGPILLVCPTKAHSKYTIMQSRKKFAELGAPLCPDCRKPLVPKNEADGGEGDDE